MRYYDNDTDWLRERVYDLILRSGAAGYTDEEIADVLDLDGDVLRPRRNELVIAERVTDSGKRRRTQRGRTAKVWLTTRVAEKMQQHA